MEKLLQYLEEFKPTMSCANFKEHYEYIVDDDIYLIRVYTNEEEERFPMDVCYRKGEFIQRLVDNDKIDWKADKIRKSQLCYLYDAEQLSIENSDFLIQLLSTQDNPVDFLIEILK